MSDLFLRLEIQDENDQAFVVTPNRGEAQGIGCTLRRFNKSQLSYAVRNLNNIKSRIVKGKEVRLYADCIDQTGLVGFWSFDGDAKDDSPPKGSHNGAIESGTWQNGELVFNGTNTRIVLGNVLDSPGSGLTVCATIRPSDVSASANRIVCKYDGAGLDNGAIVFDVLSGGILRFVFNSGGVARTASSAAGIIAAGNEYDVMAKYDGAAIKVYAKLSSDTTFALVASTSLVSSIPTLSQAWSIGEDSPAGTAEWFHGVIKKVKIHSVAYTDQEVTDAGNGKVVSRGLVGYWRLDEGQGTTAFDSVTEKYNANITNATPIQTGGYSFAGNGYAEIPYRAKLAPTDVITFGGKFYSANWAAISDWRPLISKTEVGGYAMHANETLQAPNTLSVWVRRNGGYGIAKIALSSLSPGEHVFIGRYDGRYTQLFVDGVLVDTNDAGANYPIQYSVNNSLFIAAEASTGSTPDGAVNKFVGNCYWAFVQNLAVPDADIFTRSTSNIQNKRLLTAVNDEIVAVGTFNETLQIDCDDFYDDLCLSDDIHKKYADQEVATTVTDIIGVINTKRSAGLTTGGIQTLGISQPYNFVSENLAHAFGRITGSSYSELFMRPNKEIVLRPLAIVDSGITLIDSQIREPDKVNVRNSIKDSYGIVRVVGGLSTEAYDLGKRIMTEVVVPDAPSTISKRVYNVLDERFTTFMGAKVYAMTLAQQYGVEGYNFNEPLQLHDLTKLPNMGEIVNVNSTKLAISNIKFIADELEIDLPAGQASVKYVGLKLGNSEQNEKQALELLRDVYEDDKRKKLDVDTSTNEKFFSVAIKRADGLTVTITARNKSTNPYLEGNGSDRATDAHESFATFDDGA